MARHADRRRVPPASRRSRPIILLDIAAPASDDRSFSDWARFFALPPLHDDPDAGASDSVEG